MNTGVYVVSVAVSAMYFVGPDNRIKYFPRTIDLISDAENPTEPVGLVSVECVETKKTWFRLFESSVVLIFIRCFQLPAVQAF
jgi:hypothetical protein